ESHAREMFGLPCLTRPARDQPGRIPSQTVSAGATADSSTSQASRHRLPALAPPVGGFSACHRRDATSGAQQWTGCRIVSLLAATENNHQTNYETDRNGRLPIAAKRSSRDISSSLRNSKAGQERRLVSPDAIAGSGCMKQESPSVDYHRPLL